MTSNSDYTKLWTADFDVKKALQYDNKFYKKFEKNIKHKEQINIIKKYLKKNSIWLDAPVGSGRIMHDITHDKDKCFIFDYSEVFLKFSSERLKIKDTNIFQGDIFALNLGKKFDLITCNNMLFAFEKFDLIIENLINHLGSNGILICDVVNRNMYKNSIVPHNKEMKKSNGWDENDIIKFCQKNNCELIEVIAHDYFDNEYVISWRFKGNKFTKKLKSLLWIIVNKLYFKLHLYNFFHALEDKNNLAHFNKLILVVRKNA
jgi:hypothetical protein